MLPQNALDSNGSLCLLAFVALRSSTALDTLSGRSIDVVSGNPTLIICFGSARDGRTISSQYGYLIGWIDLLPSQRALRALTTLPSTALLREECGDPGTVDEVASPRKESTEEEIEEDAANYWLACLLARRN